TPTPSASLIDVLDDVAKVVVVDTTVLGAPNADGQLLGVALGADQQAPGKLASVGVATDGQLINVQAVGGVGAQPNAAVKGVQEALGPTVAGLVQNVTGTGAGGALEQVNTAAGGATGQLLGGTGLLNVDA